MIRETIKIGTLNCIVRYPDKYVVGKQCPVFLYLHGAGSRGSDPSLLSENAALSLTENIKDFPFITILPQCESNTWFDVFEQLQALAEVIYHAAYCDSERLYLAGSSMGGYAAWQLAMSRPELFAALVPICGGGMSWNAARLKSVPIWAFHGEQDTAVLPFENELLVDRVNANGGQARLTVYPGVAHNAWSYALIDPALYKWLLSCKNTHGNTGEDIYRDRKKFG